MNTVHINAAQYANFDDCLTAAANDYAEANGLHGWNLEPQWEDDQREVIILTVPTQ